MNTKTLTKLILEPDVEGNNIRALSFLAFSIIAFIATGIVFVVRLM